MSRYRWQHHHTYRMQAVLSRSWLCSIVVLWLFVLTTLAPQPVFAQHPTQRPYIINNRQYYPIPDARGFRQRGIASWYGRSFHGRKTSNGETYNMYSMTAAHKTLPMNTMVLVKNLENGKKTVVRINDRGPFVRGRIIDLSYKAARQIDMVKKGVARVQIIALGEKRFSKRSGRTTLVYQNPNVGEFYVQVGAFRKKDNALRLQKRFQDVGHYTIIQARRSAHTNQLLYRVQVYVGKTLKQARQAEKSILDHGWKGAFIIAH